MKLNEHGLKKCSDLWSLSLAHLQKGLGFGEKTGQLLWQACRGIDKRPVQVVLHTVLRARALLLSTHACVIVLRICR